MIVGGFTKSHDSQILSSCDFIVGVSLNPCLHGYAEKALRFSWTMIFILYSTDLKDLYDAFGLLKTE